METKITKCIRIAYLKGYRVTDDGTLLGIRGRPITTILKKGYPFFALQVGTEYSKDGYYKIPAHRFAAYCFYGEEIFNHRLVRHLNANKNDYSRQNLALGNHSQNSFDRPAVERSNHAKASHTVTRIYPSKQKVCKIAYCKYSPCGKVFDITRDNRKNRPRKHCSYSCAAKNRKKS